MATVYAVQSYGGTLTASTAQLVQFTSTGLSSGTPIRYAYVLIENTGSGIIYAITTGSAATVNGDYCTAINAGTSGLMANDAPYWTQAANVIPKGTLAGNGPLTGTPYVMDAPYGSSLYGTLASPGTSVSIISAGTPSYTISGTG